MNGEMIERVADKEASGIRIDKYLSMIEEKLSRSYLQKLITEGHVVVNEQIIVSVKETNFLILFLHQKMFRFFQNRFH